MHADPLMSTLHLQKETGANVENRRIKFIDNILTKQYFNFFVHSKALNDRTKSFLKRIVSMIDKSCRS